MKLVERCTGDRIAVDSSAAEGDVIGKQLAGGRGLAGLCRGASEGCEQNKGGDELSNNLHGFTILEE